MEIESKKRKHYSGKEKIYSNLWIKSTIIVDVDLILVENYRINISK